MSYYIQDNVAVIETKEKSILVLLKGGDNNVISYQGKRLSEWRILKTFNDEQSYYNYISEICFDDIKSGNIKIASHINKDFDGYYDKVISAFERYDKAFKSRIISDVELSPLMVEINNASTENNLDAFKLFKTKVSELIYSLENDMIKKNFKLTNQDGNYSRISSIIFVEDFKRYKELFNSLFKGVNYTNEKTDNYIEFIKNYKGKTLEECCLDLNFCEKITKDFIDDNWRGENPLYYYTKALDIPYENFKTLFISNPNSILKAFKDDFKYLVKSYPGYIKQIREDGYVKDFKVALKNFSDKYYEKDAKVILEYFKNISNEELDKMQNEKELQRELKINGAKDEFIKLWNNIEKTIYYKNTHEKFPRELKEMKNLIELGDLKVQDFYINSSNSLLYSFDENSIKRKISNQSKKNQKAIENGFKYIAENFSEYLSDKDKEVIKNLFEIKAKEKEVKSIELN